MPNLRIMIRCCLPNGDHHSRAINTLEHYLADTFGGFTSYSMVGAWINPQGKLNVKNGTIYEISFVPTSDKFNLALEAFRNAGQKMGETWVHIERHEYEFLAYHTQVNPN